MIKLEPAKHLTQRIDWRLLNELRELKA